MQNNYTTMKRPKREEHLLIVDSVCIVSPKSYMPALEQYCDYLEKDREKLRKREDKAIEKAYKKGYKSGYRDRIILKEAIKNQED